MTTYSDALGEKVLYEAWLQERADSGDLAEQICGMLHQGGYTVPQRFRDQLGSLMADVLAEFIAGNTPIEDDYAWQCHCAANYPADLNPCLTAAERNGGAI